MEHTEWELHQKIHMVDSLVDLIDQDSKYSWTDSCLTGDDRVYIMNALVMLGDDLYQRLKKC